MLPAKASRLEAVEFGAEELRARFESYAPSGNTFDSAGPIQALADPVNEDDTSRMDTPISREEMHAELNSMRSDMRASSSDLRADFERMQRGVIETITQVAVAAAETRGEVKKLEGALAGIDGKIDGLKSSITTTQWVIGIGLAVVAIIISVAAIVISGNQSGQVTAPTPAHMQPILIQVPAQPQTAQPSEK